MQPEINPSKLSSASPVDEELWAFQQSLLQSPYNLPEEKVFFSERIDVRRVPKGEFLIRQGQRLFHSYHLFKGCIREYYVKDGEEKTMAFYTVGDSLFDDGDQQNQLPSSVNWETVSDCIISDMPHEVEREMYRRFPRLESLCRLETAKQYSRYKKSQHYYLASSPEERYENLIETKPELFQLVPLYHIASYLGVTPESLSRIRRRMKLS